MHTNLTSPYSAKCSVHNPDFSLIDLFDKMTRVSSKWNRYCLHFIEAVQETKIHFSTDQDAILLHFLGPTSH